MVGENCYVNSFSFWVLANRCQNSWHRIPLEVGSLEPHKIDDIPSRTETCTRMTETKHVGQISSAFLPENRYLCKVASVDSNSGCCQIAVAVVVVVVVVGLEAAGFEAFAEKAIESEAEHIVAELVVAVAVIELVLVVVLDFVVVELAKTSDKNV